MQRHLSLGNILISLRESLNVLLNSTVVAEELNVSTIDLDTTLLAETDVFVATQGSETPVLGDDDLLATGELVHGATEGLDGEVTVGVTGADRQQDLADVHTGDGTVGLAEGTTHTGLETIGTSARKHLVVTDDVEGVGTDTKVETFLSSGLDEVLVGANTGGFESLRGQLLVFVGDHVHTGREVIDIGLLTSKIEDTDLWVGDTTVEAGLGVGLVLAVAVATGRTTGHLECEFFK
jgi:hypothetical protein